MFPVDRNALQNYQQSLGEGRCGEKFLFKKLVYSLATKSYQLSIG